MKFGNISEVDLEGNKKLDQWFDENIAKKFDEVGREILQWLSSVLSYIVDLVAIGILFLLYYNIVKWMFIRDDKCLQRIIFGFFLILLLRIFAAVLRLDITL
jgi:ABC-type sulfate transport system permease subunit